MCWKCGKAIELDRPAGRSMTCPSCGSDIRSCRNCRFWSPGSFHDCAERVEDPVSDKERANFCDRFQVNPPFRVDHPAASKGGAAVGGSAGCAAADGGAKSSAAKSAFDGLFGE